MRDNFSTHPQAPRSYILVLASMLIFNTGPVFAQQTVHAQTTVKFGNANTTFGPVSSGCDAINGGPECKFLSFETDGTCETREEIGHANFGNAHSKPRQLFCSLSLRAGLMTKAAILQGYAFRSLKVLRGAMTTGASWI